MCGCTHMEEERQVCAREEVVCVHTCASVLVEEKGRLGLCSERVCPCARVGERRRWGVRAPSAAGPVHLRGQRAPCLHPAYS